MVDDGSGVRRIVSTAATPQICPGFCGRVASWPPGNVTYSDCQACSWGYRTVDKFLCLPCDDPLPLYDWLYLTFVAIVPLLLHSFFIQFYAPKNSVRFHQLSQHLCCIWECLISILITLIIFPPRGSLSLRGCTKWSLREWYPMFYNPVVNHTHILRCTHEVVFPLYSLPFVYFCFCLFSLIFLRSILYATVLRRTTVSSNPYYAALYSIPLVAITHSVLAGVLYYSFAYITLLCSLGLNAVHLALERNRCMRTLCKETIFNLRHVSLLMVHMALFGFSLFALTIGRTSSFSVIASIAVFLLVPLPSIFYFLTVGLTHPLHVHSSS